jgi:opacity protein-like surface antigen
MKRYLMAAVAATTLVASGASAQSHQQGSHNPALKDPHPHQLAAPAHGANSFSEDQARGRLTKAGYARIGKLTKDKNGVWRGMAYRGNARVSVGLDYKGNVVR